MNALKFETEDLGRIKIIKPWGVVGVSTFI
jgi:hypothetical protein